MPANILTSPRSWAKKAILSKLEATYAVDATPTGAVDWVEARNVNFTPMDVTSTERNIELPYFGDSGEVLTGFWAKLSYDIALAPSGTLGTAPKWGKDLMACGFAETITAGASVEYNLVSESFSSETKYINIDGTLHSLLGVRGNAKFKFEEEGIPMMSLAYDCIYVDPVAGLMPSVTRTGWMIEEGVNAANTTKADIDGVGFAFSSLEFDLGYKVERLNLPGPQVEVRLASRKVTGSITVLAPELATFNPFTKAKDAPTVPLTVTHGTVAGKKVQVNLKVRLGAPEYTQIKGLVGYKIPFTGTPVSGNDEFSLKLI